MKVIIKPRRGGKTSELIKIAAEDWLYIVCIDRKESTRIFNVARKLDLQIPFPITFSDLRHGEFCSTGIKGFLIDNADLLLNDLCVGKLKGLSMSED